MLIEVEIYYTYIFIHYIYIYIYIPDKRWRRPCFKSLTVSLAILATRVITGTASFFLSSVFQLFSAGSLITFAPGFSVDVHLNAGCLRHRIMVVRVAPHHRPVLV